MARHSGAGSNSDAHDFSDFVSSGEVFSELARWEEVLRDVDASIFDDGCDEGPEEDDPELEELGPPDGGVLPEPDDHEADDHEADELIRDDSPSACPSQGGPSPC